MRIILTSSIAEKPVSGGANVLDTHDLAAYGSGRVTPQRALIARLAAARPCAFTVDELAETVRSLDPAIGLATLYRAVSAMEGCGFLERVGERDGSALYLRCHASGSGEHHHHVVCEGCGRVEFAGCPLPELDDAARSGFLVTRHEVTLYGLCPDCANRGS